MKRFSCGDVIPGCHRVFTGVDDQGVLDQVLAHAAADHGLIEPPMALVGLVIAHTQPFVPGRDRAHLRVVDASPLHRRAGTRAGAGESTRAKHRQARLRRNLGTRDAPRGQPNQAHRAWTPARAPSPGWESSRRA